MKSTDWLLNKLILGISVRLLIHEKSDELNNFII